MVSILTTPIFQKMLGEEDAIGAVVVVGLTEQPDAVLQTETWSHKVTISQDPATFKTGVIFVPEEEA
jgi:hypothetical protein